MNKEICDIKERSGKYCTNKMVCADNDCALKDKLTGACVYWLINNNMYHVRTELECLNKSIKDLTEILKEKK